MKATKKTLIIMSKAPLPGAVKTRLCPPLDPSIAAGLHEAFIRDIIDSTSGIPDTDLILAYTPVCSLRLFEEIAPERCRFVPQSGVDIGSRMLHLMESYCCSTCPVVIIGTDSPTLPENFITQAFDIIASEQADIVFGPALDGGYYLVGTKYPYPSLFTEINWSTSSVLSESLHRCGQLGLNWSLLPEWYDIDTAADLSLLKEELAGDPTLNYRIPCTHAFVESLRKRGII